MGTTEGVVKGDARRLDYGSCCCPRLVRLVQHGQPRHARSMPRLRPPSSILQTWCQQHTKLSCSEAQNYEVLLQRIRDLTWTSRLVILDAYCEGSDK